MSYLNPTDRHRIVPFGGPGRAFTIAAPWSGVLALAPS
jgi:hypothetical protein